MTTPETKIPLHDPGDLESPAAGPPGVDQQPDTEAAGHEIDQEGERESYEQRAGLDLLDDIVPIPRDPNQPWKYSSESPIHCWALPIPVRRGLEIATVESQQFDSPIRGYERTALLAEDWRLMTIEEYYLSRKLEGLVEKHTEHYADHETLRLAREANSHRNRFWRENSDNLANFRLYREASKLHDNYNQTKSALEARQARQQALDANKLKWGEVHDQFAHPTWRQPLRKLGLVRPSTKAEDKSQLTKAQQAISKIEEESARSREQSVELEPKAATLTERWSDMARHLADKTGIHGPSELAQRLDELEPIHQQSLDLEQQLGAAVAKDRQHDAVGREVGGEIERVRDKIKNLNEERWKLYESLPRGGYLSLRVAGSTIAEAQFDSNNRAIIESSRWQPPEGTPAEVKTAADFRRWCAEQLIEQGYQQPSTTTQESTTRASSSPAEKVESRPAGNEDRNGYSLVPLSETPSNYDEKPIPDKLPESVAVSCADLGQRYRDKFSELSVWLLDHSRGHPRSYEEHYLDSLEEDCRRREIDRYQALKQLHETKQALNELNQREVAGWANITSVENRSQELAVDGRNWDIDQYEQYQPRVAEGQQLRRDLDQLKEQQAGFERQQAELEYGRDQLRKLDLQQDHWQAVRQQLEPNWHRNPLQKLGLVRPATKNRLEREREAAEHHLSNIDRVSADIGSRQEQTETNPLTDKSPNILQLEQDERIQKLPRLTEQLAQLKPTYDKARNQRKQLHRQRARHLAEAYDLRRQIEENQQKAAEAQVTAEQIYEEIQQFFGFVPDRQNHAPADIYALTSNRVNGYRYHVAPDGRVIIYDGNWRGPGGEISVADYRREQAARARGLDPRVMARPPQERMAA